MGACLDPSIDVSTGYEAEQLAPRPRKLSILLGSWQANL